MAGRGLVVHWVSRGPTGLRSLGIGEIGTPGKGFRTSEPHPHRPCLSPQPGKTLFHPSWLATRQSLWHKPGVARALAPGWPCCGSSVVEHSIGNGEVDSSILSRSTIYLNKIKNLENQPFPRTSLCALCAALAPPAQSPQTVKQHQCCGEWRLVESALVSQARVGMWCVSHHSEQQHSLCHSL